jgi:hypothetical protein
MLAWQYFGACPIGRAVIARLVHEGPWSVSGITDAARGRSKVDRAIAVRLETDQA